jgi:hypothetical protein
MRTHNGPGGMAPAEAGIFIAGQRSLPDNTTAGQTPDWSPKQYDAIDAIATWLGRGDEQVFYFAGYAGVGKTTLLKYIGSIAGDTVLYGSYTGRAAAVARKGCIGASTIDRLIYSHPYTWTCATCAAPPCAETLAGTRGNFQPRELNRGPTWPRPISPSSMKSRW